MSYFNSSYFSDSPKEKDSDGEEEKEKKKKEVKKEAKASKGAAVLKKEETKSTGEQYVDYSLKGCSSPCWSVTVLQRGGQKIYLQQTDI